MITGLQTKKLFLILLLLYNSPLVIQQSIAQQSILEFTTAEKAWIVRQDTVYFGYDPDWKPYEFINSQGKHDGILEQLVQLIRDRSGLNLQPYPNLTWQSSVEALKKDVVQVLPCIGITEDRTTFMSFTSTYMSFPFVIINSKEGEFVGDMQDLKGLTLAMPKGYVITKKVERDYPDINIVYTHSLEEALLLVVTNKVDATIEGLAVASYYLNYRGFDNLQIAGNTDEYNIELNMSVKKGNDTLLSVLEKSLNSISPSEKQKLINKWVTVKYEHGVNMARVWKIAGLSALLVIMILGVIIFWNRSLKREIQKRKKAEEQLKASNKDITDSINYALHIQSAILPPAKLVGELLNDSFILYKPKDIVAGDFYWLEVVGNQCLFAAADCTGHGVPGAMVSVVCHNALNRSVREFQLTEPGKILDKVRELVIETFENSDHEVKDGMDIALCSITLAPAQGSERAHLQYAGAYNPLWIIRNGEVLETKAHPQPIGICDDPRSYTTNSFDLDKGDALYIFSDGYADQFGGQRGKKLKAKAFKELLVSMHDTPMEEQKLMIDEAFENWKGELEQIDDVCVIGVKI